MKILRYIFILITAVLWCQPVCGQIVQVPNETIDTDSVRRAFDEQPFFGLYKDNYFIFGPAIGPKPTVENTNVKFQISIAQRITKAVLPWNTYLYLFYSQKVFWNVLQNSLPMTDLNFNPGIGLAKPLFVTDRYIGKVMLVLEHESNGKDGDASRSWNKVSLGANIMIDPNFMVHAKFWIPMIDGAGNRDILKYNGVYQTGVQLMSSDRRFNCSITLVKRSGINLNFNTIVEGGMRLWKNANEYLFFQYYNGYGEGLLDYNKYHSQFRVGIQIKPTLFSDY